MCARSRQALKFENARCIFADRATELEIDSAKKHTRSRHDDGMIAVADAPGAPSNAE
jgi:hypothetical protein